MGIATDYDAMSDEEFLLASDNIPIAEPIETEDSNEEGQDVDVEVEVDVEESTDTEEPDDTGEEDTNSESDDDTGDTQDDDGNADADQDDSEDSADTGDSEDDGEETDHSDGDEESSEETDFDFESGYKDILKPFKANGKDMQVDSVEDARQLMKMGAGFSKRMQKIKPHLKIVKSLKDNDLLDQDKLDHLIELSKGNPDAIAKLLKEKGVDPLDIKLDGAGDYKPESHEVSDSAYNLDEAIDGIRGTDTFEKSMDVMGKQWDSKSRTIIADNPDIVGVINDHVQSGVFEAVQTEVDKERALGRLTGLSDVEAYREAASTLQKSGVLVGNNGEPKKTKSDSEGNSLEREAGKVNKKKKAETAKAKKKAAAPSRGTGSSKKQTVDLSKLSDEDFLKEYEKL